MGLNISASIQQSYINAILECLQSRKYCKAIMDDVLLFTPSKKFHIAKLEDLLKALLKNGLKISPKKCQLFRKELQYMGNTIFVEDSRVCIKPLRSRLEATQKLKLPTIVKGCRLFAGMVHFICVFCPELQKLLKPIYDLTRKGRQFIWGKEQQTAFEEIKLSNFLSGQKHDDSNPHEIIPISFNMQGSLQARYYNIGEGNSGKYLVQTWSLAKSSGIKLPEVHHIGKCLDPNIQPEKQVVKPITVIKGKEVSQVKPRLGQGRAGLRCKINTSISKPLMQVTE